MLKIILHQTPGIMFAQYIMDGGYSKYIGGLSRVHLGGGEGAQDIRELS